MTKIELIERLYELPKLIEDAENAVINAHGQVQDSKSILSEVEDVLLLSGSIDGKNVEIRNAQLRAQTSNERQAIQKVENELSVARIALNRLNNEQANCRAIAEMLEGVK